MGRKLMRVPLDFKWPQGQTWIGYLNPYRCHECKECGGSGLNKEMKRLSDEWYGWHSENWVYLTKNRRYNADAHQYNITQTEVDALVRACRLTDFTGFVRFDEELNSWIKWVDKEPVKCEAPVFPTAEEVNEWAKIGFGHDSINQSICVRARAKELGVDGNCEMCSGEGYLFQSDHIRKLNEEWVDMEPPAGEGYQMWETTSEGSPKSPVFKTMGELCEWCAENSSTFADFKATKEEWMQMLDDGLVYHKKGNMIML